MMAALASISVRMRFSLSSRRSRLRLFRTAAAPGEGDEAGYGNQRGQDRRAQHPGCEQAVPQLGFADALLQAQLDRRELGPHCVHGGLVLATEYLASCGGVVATAAPCDDLLRHGELGIHQSGQIVGQAEAMQVGELRRDVLEAGFVGPEIALEPGDDVAALSGLHVLQGGQQPFRSDDLVVVVDDLRPQALFGHDVTTWPR